MRLLILCTANSARSQMAEGWARYYAQKHGLDLEVHSAGTKATRVNPNAIAAMAERGIDISTHHSKTLFEVPDPWNFDYVLTVCDSAAENCPVYPAKTTRLHHSFPDPAAAVDEPSAFREGGQHRRPEPHPHAAAVDEPSAFREVRDRIGPFIEQLILALKHGKGVATVETG